MLIETGATTTLTEEALFQFKAIYQTEINTQTQKHTHIYIERYSAYYVQCLNLPVSTHSLPLLDKILVALISAFIFLYILFLYNVLQLKKLITVICTCEGSKIY